MDDRAGPCEVDARHAADHALAVAWKDPALAIDRPVAAADELRSDAGARAMRFTDCSGRRRAAQGDR